MIIPILNPHLLSLIIFIIVINVRNLKENPAFCDSPQNLHPLESMGSVLSFSVLFFGYAESNEMTKKIPRW